jgi:hypothetical protein
MPILAAELFDKADSYRKKFDTAKPFRHVLISQFFDPAIAEAMLAEFPVPRESEMINEFGIKNRKFACRDVRSIGPTYCLIDDYISSPEFAHVDFNVHPATKHHRRFNAIIYLNKEWKEEWGGNLELHTNPWDLKTPDKGGGAPEKSAAILPGSRPKVTSRNTKEEPFINSR